MTAAKPIAIEPFTATGSPLPGHRQLGPAMQGYDDFEHFQTPHRPVSVSRCRRGCRLRRQLPSRQRTPAARARRSGFQRHPLDSHAAGRPLRRLEQPRLLAEEIREFFRPLRADPR
jgi:hypothetical protein